MFTASQEDLTEQIKLSDEVLVIPKVEIKHDQIQVKLEKEKPENDSKEEPQMSGKKRRRSSKKEHDPITEGRLINSALSSQSEHPSPFLRSV